MVWKEERRYNVVAGSINYNTLYSWNPNSEFSVNQPKPQVKRIQQQAQQQGQQVRKPKVVRKGLYLPSNINMVPKLKRRW